MIKGKGKAWSGIHISLEKEGSFLPWSVLYTPLYRVEVEALLGCSVEGGDTPSARKSPSSSDKMNWLCVLSSRTLALATPASWILWLKTGSLVSKCTTQFTGVFLKLERSLFSLFKWVGIMCVLSSELHWEDSCIGPEKTRPRLGFLNVVAQQRRCSSVRAASLFPNMNGLWDFVMVNLSFLR